MRAPRHYALTHEGRTYVTNVQKIARECGCRECGTSESGGGEVSIDSTGNINTTGDIIYQGNLINDVVIRPGVAVTAFAPRSTQATIEDSGTAQLVGGAAIVPLDAA